MYRIVSVIAPEAGLKIFVRDTEVAPRRVLLEEFTVSIKRLRSCLLEDDSAAILRMQGAVDFPLQDERRSNFFAGGVVLWVLR